jgi:hypothetical protein
MRMNLKVPFAEKDAAKALGARWDAARKIWYVTDVADLAPFLRWIPDMETAKEVSTDGATLPTKSTSKVPIHQFKGPTAKSTIEVPHCGCNVLPWDDCEHTV